MKNSTCLALLLTLGLCSTAARAETDDGYSDWKNRPTESFSDPESSFKKVKQLLLEKYYDSKLTEEQLYRAATDGMLRALNGSAKTSYNKLLSPTELHEMEVDLKGQVTGIGVEIKFDEASGVTTVTGVNAGSPAEKGDLKVGDQIVSIDGKISKGLQFRDVVYSIRGRPGEKVKLKVLRGDSILSRGVVREDFAWSPVTAALLGENVGLLSISYFNEKTPEAIRAALKKLQAEGMHSLVVDLRGNNGGLFEQAVESAGLFVAKDTVVARVAMRDGQEEAFRSSGGEFPASIPVALLVNEETASSAELFAASLSENLGAKLIGARTKGKWSVQTVETLPNHFAAKFTVEAFKSPRGRSYADVGLEPDVQVAAADPSGKPFARVHAGPKFETLASARWDGDPSVRAARSLLGESLPR